MRTVAPRYGRPLPPAGARALFVGSSGGGRDFLVTVIRSWREASGDLSEVRLPDGNVTRVLCSYLTRSPGVATSAPLPKES